ncbi:MAG: formate dehydrogenase accessory sulfurtransferase FdhD [Bacteroidota bacterium]
MNNPTLNYSGIKYLANNKTINTNDPIAIEQMLNIAINHTALAVLMRTPGNDEELIRGFLYTEDIYKDKNTNPELEITKTDKHGFTTEINVKIDPINIQKGYLNVRSLLSVSSCGICGKTELHPASNSNSNNTPKQEITFEFINKLFNDMQKQQTLFNLTGGTHAAAGFDKSGNLLCIHEDIGRHNAVDKVIGDLLINKNLSNCNILLLSGRASYEIVTKCFIAGIQTLAVVSAPSSLAVDYAKELGVRLIGFCRNDRMTAYS